LVKSLNGAHIDKVTQNTKARQITYSISDEKADYYAKNISYGEKTNFDLYHRNEKVCSLETNQLGSDTVENIIGCSALLLEKKLITVEQLQDASRLFLGVKGRMDKKENNSSVLVYEAFGSSQSKLKSSFKALKLHFPNKKIIAVFEPHTFSWRNRNALSWYTHTFDDAKHVLVFEPPTHGENKDQLSLDEIVSKIKENHKSVFPFHSSEEGLGILKNITQKDDIVLLITSGDLGGIIPKVPKLMEELF
jgi:UDP-N-acetylmuramate: L-alanyl-gamma-D-glutamyl-meso-diaminopimelate ligase